jgi:spore maturation protein SpmB
MSVASFPNLRYISGGAFTLCTKLVSLYLLGSNMVTLTSSAFVSTPLMQYSYTGDYGSIYVPASLYSSYIKAAYWSAMSARFVSV